MMLEILKLSLLRSAGYMLVCHAFYLGGKAIAKFYPYPKFLELPANIRAEWFMKHVSLYHSIIMSSGIIYYWIMINPTQKFTVYVTEYQAFMLDIMMGYLWYDIGVEFITGAPTVDIIGHHVMGLASHYSTRLSNNGAAGFYSMLVYVAELSTPFLNTSWLLHHLKMKDTILFKILAAMLILLFFFCRYLLGPYMVYHMLNHRAAWGDDSTELNLLYWGNTLVVSAFAALNIFWFHKLVSTVFSSKSKKKDQ